MLVGPFAGGLAYRTMRLFAAGPHGVHILCDLCASFGCSTLAYLAQKVQPQIDPTIVTVSGVLCLIPSSTITLGISDMLSRHVLSGLERLVKGMIIMLWLEMGYVQGMSFVAFMIPGDKGDDGAVMEEMNTIPALWQLLFIPILCSCVAVITQMSGKDMPCWVCSLDTAHPSLVSFSLISSPALVPSWGHSIRDCYVRQRLGPVLR